MESHGEAAVDLGEKISEYVSSKKIIPVAPKLEFGTQFVRQPKTFKAAENATILKPRGLEVIMRSTWNIMPCEWDRLKTLTRLAKNRQLSSDGIEDFERLVAEISTKITAGLNRGIGATPQQEKLLDSARDALYEVQLHQIALMGD